MQRDRSNDSNEMKYQSEWINSHICIVYISAKSIFYLHTFWCDLFNEVTKAFITNLNFSPKIYFYFCIIIAMHFQIIISIQNDGTMNKKPWNCRVTHTPKFSYEFNVLKTEKKMNCVYWLNIFPKYWNISMSFHVINSVITFDFPKPK